MTVSIALSAADNLSIEANRFLQFERLSPGNPIGFARVAIRLHGPANIDVLRRAVHKVIEKHSALRTYFTDNEGRCIPSILPTISVDIPLVDRCNILEEDREREIIRLLDREIAIPFDISKPPLFRVIIIRFDEELHALGLIAHSLIFDIESAKIFFSDLSVFYDSSVSGTPSVLPPPSTRSLDSGRWRRQWLRKVGRQAHLTYWREQLSGVLPILEMPLDKHRPLKRSFRGTSLSQVLPAELVKKLRAFAERQGVTFASVLMAGFYGLLSRYAGQEDILVGLTVFSRENEGIGNVIGQCSDWLPIRVTASSSGSFCDLVERTSKALASAEEHSTIMFSNLISELRLPEDESRNLLFQAAFSYDERSSSARLRHLVMDYIELPAISTEVDIALNASLTESQLTITFLYSNDLFEQTTIRRMLGHYKNLLASALESPETAIGMFPILNDAEKHKILCEWNQKTQDLGSCECIHRWFEVCAVQNPHVTAIAFERQAVSYEAMNARSNQIAHYLQGLGVGPDTLVGICFDRSIDLIESIFGVLKAGGAFLPLDPSYPKERLRFMLEDSGAAILLGNANHIDELGLRAPQTIRFESISNELTGQSDKNPQSPVSSRNLAYVIYTSGSTGKPKGVQLEHQGLCNLIAASKKIWGVSPGFRILQFAKISFDASVWEIFTALGLGATLVVAPQEALLPGPDLARLLREQEINGVLLSPTALAATSPEMLPSLKTIVSGGEACTEELVNKWAPGRRFVNAYGPTEITVCVTTCDCYALAGQPSIGKSIPNMQAYILDKSLQPVPIGVPGELYIGGIGLARGYINRPELTAERFVKNPVGSDPEARLYKTGDRVRWLSDGRIDFMGRLDDQIKLRGFRIELGEIETVLLHHTSVREAAVVLRTDNPADPRIVAYIAAKGNTRPTANEIRNFLKERLPQFMLPSAFIFMDSLPLSPAGKVDKKALPAPTKQKIDSDEFGAETRSIESVLVQHHSIRKAIVIIRAKPGGEKQIIAHCFKRGNEIPESDELRVFFKGRLSNELMPGVFIQITLEQERHCYLELLSPGNPSQIHVAAMRIDGALDIKNFRKAFDEVVRRHAVLRTTFPIMDRRPTRSVEKAMTIEMQYLDLSLLFDLDWEGEILRQCSEELGRPFDLVTGPLFRTSLLKFGREMHVLVIAAHRSIFDDGSALVLMREIGNSYENVMTGRALLSSDIPLPTLDYARWQRRWLRSLRLEEHLESWKKQLSGELPILELPIDFPHSKSRAYAAATSVCVFPSDLAEDLEDVSTKLGVPLPITLLAAFITLLYRYSGQDDIIVGVPVSGRKSPESRDIIGCFAYALPLRVDLSGSPEFGDLIKRVAAASSFLEEHADIPFATLLEDLRLPSDSARAPLFQAAFEYRNTAAPGVRIQGLTFTNVDLPRSASEVDLHLCVNPAQEGLTVSIIYNANLFKHATIERMHNHLQTLLSGIVGSPSELISNYNILTVEEQHRLSRDWQGRKFDDTGMDLCAHELFEDCAEQSPTDTAIAFETSMMTYAELDRAANRVAHLLRARGIGPDTLVGVCLERSLDLIVVILGTLKAGGAFIPLDPTYPPERIRFMMEDSGAPIVIASQESVHRLGLSIEKILYLDEMQRESIRYPDWKPEVGISPSNLAYAIYTSGSTGKPKGALIEHRGWVNLALSQKRMLGVGSGVRVIQFAKISFDAAIWEIAMSLLVGGTLVLATQDHLMPGPDLVRTLRERNIEVALLPPSAVSVMSPEDLPQLRTLIVGGEACSEALVEHWSPGRKLLNAYGPTEITVCATMDECIADGARPPIGRPLPNFEVYILDRFMNPVPVGVPGELYIGSIALARGYLNRPALTAERFVPNPIPRGTTSRLYRSGDKVKWLPDGRIDFIGRFDDQVKVHGFRIELGEIESVLLKHSSVRDAVVIVREDVQGDRRIVAYIVSKPDTEVDHKLLHIYLGELLPAYMVPSSIVLLSELPLSPSGKVDRKALPPPTVLLDTGDAGYVAPRNQTEQSLVTLWSRHLHVSRIGVYDDLNQLGAHSLLYAQVLTRIRALLDIDLSIRDLFESPTVAELARRIDHARTFRRGPTLPPISRIGRDKPIPLSIGQQQLWLILQANPNSPVYNECATLEIKDELDTDIFHRALNEIQRRHEVLRTNFVMVDTQPAQLISKPSEFPLAIEDITNILSEESRYAEMMRRATAEGLLPFNLAEGPLWRVTLFKFNPQHYYVFFTFHHIIFDGVSLNQLFISELGAVYGAFSQGKPSLLPELQLQFADYAVWQRNTLTAPALERQISALERRLSGVPLLELPLDRPRPAEQTFEGEKYKFRLDFDLVEDLKALASREGVTPFMVFTAAFNVLLQRYSNQDDIVIGTVVAGRLRPEWSNLIGFFVNSVPIRSNLGGNPTFLDYLRRVKGEVTEALATQDVPFEILVEELRVPRTRSHNPLFQVVIGMSPLIPPINPKWSLRQFDVDTKTAKMDLVLHLDEYREQTVGIFEYNSLLFDRESIALMHTHLEQMLMGIRQNPNCYLSELPLMREAERAEILSWSVKKAGPTRPSCIHELFDAQVKLCPEAIAVICGAHRYTYEELNRRSNQLANYLHGYGVGPEVMVGLVIDRSIDIAVGILGVMKAGGAYVPIDPDEPPSRLAQIIADSQAAIIIAQEHLLDRLPAGVSKIIRIDSDWPEINREAITAPAVQVSDQNLAYVIYSAGHAGKPRGVMVSHYNVVRLFQAVQNEFAFGANDVWTMFHSYTVDFSVWELWGALLHGGKLIIVPYEISRTPEAFYELVCKNRVTIMSQIPSAFRYFIQVEDTGEVDPADLSALRVVFLGGEILDIRMLGAWAERHGLDKPAIHNFYGLTGVAGFATYHRVIRDDLRNRSGSPIGKPFMDTEVYILDPYFHISPIGVPGEIFVGGPRLSRGYMNDPEFTSERFVQHPFSSDLSARLYRTRDRARYNKNGEIEFLGRADNQIKLRGFKVDPRDVEATLVEHPDIREVSAIVREDVPGDQRLVAYYVKQANHIPATNELRAYLRERLPDYMIPSVFIPVSTITYVSSGKVDRRSLPAPDRNRPSMSPVFRLPANAVEVVLLGIWTRLLQVDEIGVKDDFFSLGGHSLLAAQMIARVRETFRIDMQHSSYLMREFMENPTISAFAEVIDMLRDATPSIRARKNQKIDFYAEAALDPSIQFDAKALANVADPQNVLLTGATGFLGAFLLNDLLRRTRANVYCLVRASSAELAMERIRKNQEECKVWDSSFASRIIPLPGDLSQLLLGLSPAVFAELAQTIDIIYHNGALVNFLYPYAALKNPNVQGTREVIRMATQYRIKPVHYMSTISVLSSLGFAGSRSVDENVELALPDKLFMGYTESKWVSEKMLLNACKQGLPVSIYRPHDVVGHSVTGAWKTEGFLCSFLKAVVEMGVAPGVALPMDLQPVDYVTGAMVHISLNERAEGKAYHLNNPKYSMLQSVVRVMQNLGYGIEVVPSIEWTRKLIDFTARHPNNGISPFVPLFVERWSEEKLTIVEMYLEGHIPIFECDYTRGVLRNSDLHCPPVDEAFLYRSMKYLKDSGFFPPIDNTA